MFMFLWLNFKKKIEDTFEKRYSYRTRGGSMNSQSDHMFSIKFGKIKTLTFFFFNHGLGQKFPLIVPVFKNVPQTNFQY